MFRKYLEQTKPVVFGDVFSPQRGEEINVTLGRCHGELLQVRAKLYDRYADETVRPEDIESVTIAKDFLAVVGRGLEAASTAASRITSGVHGIILLMMMKSSCS